jgi:hypothetical protein
MFCCLVGAPLAGFSFGSLAARDSSHSDVLVVLAGGGSTVALSFLAVGVFGKTTTSALTWALLSLLAAGAWWVVIVALFLLTFDFS